jgi:hypothetical protein
MLFNDEFKASVKKRTHYDWNNESVFDQLPMNTVKRFTWAEALELLDTHPEEYRSINKDKLRFVLTKIELRGSHPNFSKFVRQELDKTFPKNQTTVHIFGGITNKCKSFEIHRDVMDVLYLQVFGSVTLSLWKPKLGFIPTSDEIEKKNVDCYYRKHFKEGRMIWIPRGTWHYIEPRQSRIGFSFGVEGKPEPSTYI